MVKTKKRSTSETSTIMAEEDDTTVTATEENPIFTNLSQRLAETSKTEGVIGYILRSATTATIDLKEPEKIVEYAILSSQTLDSTQEISELFELGNVENILIEGKDLKVLCVNIDENKISIFMEKNADHEDILKKILS